MSDESSDDENVIRYGTPLERYEEDEIPSKKRQQHGATSQQYVVNAQGQRRFHGAFTGGFQAGHGNSVAAPEGWAPSQFKSSRKGKGSFANQRPEDFMDEEDRGEFGIAPHTVQFNKDFSSNKRPHVKHYFQDGPIPGEPVLRELMSIVHESAAVRLLRGMGWKPGQGVGERQSAADKGQRRHDIRKVYGCHVPAEYRQPASTQDSEPQHSSDQHSDEDLDYDTLFAPDDFQLLLQKTKNDTFGLGYQGLSRRSVLGSLSGHYSGDVAGKGYLVLRDKGKKVSIRGQAFGVGALEEDDEDIYAQEDRSHYDYVLDTGKSEPKPDKNSRKSASVLEGFISASAHQPSSSHYAPPALPRDYNPEAGVKKSRFQSDTTTQMRERNLARHELTATQRGAMLGEGTNNTIIKPSEATPVDMIAPITNRNINATSTITVFQPKPSIENKLEQKPEHKVMEKKTADTNTFRPFATDVEKQARYEKFLEVRKGNILENTENCSERDRLMEWERVREKCEFEQAAQLYRPLTGVLSDRFTRPCQPDDLSINPLVPVTPSKTHAAATEQQVEAARIGMFGKLTRTCQDWRPDALLCKRFNVPEPHASKLTEASNKQKKTSYSIFDYLDSSVYDKECFAKEQSQFSGSKSLNRIDNTNNPHIEKSGNVIVKDNGDSSEDMVRKDVAVVNKRLTVTELFLLEKEKEHKKTVENVTSLPDVGSHQEVDETIDKFDKIDLYKAIFLSDSESDTDTNKDESRVKNLDEICPSPALVNVERNPSPPRGIFANIDFDEINSWQKCSSETSKITKVNEEKTLSQTKVKPSETNDQSIDKSDVSCVNLAGEMIYGPKLPDKPIFKFDKFDEKVNSDLESSCVDSESWFDASDKKKKRKKQKKCKLRKHKHKSKRSKHKSRN